MREPAPISNTEADKNNMTADESHLVDEILNELNDGQQQDMQQPEMQQGMPDMQQPEMQQGMPDMQPDMQDMQPDMQPDMQAMHDMQMQQEMPPSMEVKYNDNTGNTYLRLLKKPLLVLCVSFLVFNPFTKTLLSKYLPRVFAELTDNVFAKQGRTFLLALVVSLLYFGIDYLL